MKFITDSVRSNFAKLIFCLVVTSQLFQDPGFQTETYQLRTYQLDKALLAIFYSSFPAIMTSPIDSLERSHFLGIFALCLELTAEGIMKITPEPLGVRQHSMPSCLTQTAIKFLKVVEESFCNLACMTVQKTYEKRFPLVK